MTKNKTLTLTMQYQLYALIYFLFFLAQLLPLVFGPIGLLQHLNKISFIAFLGLLLFFCIANKVEPEDERSRIHYLKANSFIFHASLISILGILFLIEGVSRIAFTTQIISSILIALAWLLLFSRNIAFLIFEKLESA